MANFSAIGTVIAVTARGKGHVVSLKEKDDRPHIDIYTFGTPPMVGQEVMAIGYVNGREYNGKVYPDISATFAAVIHSTNAGEYRPMPERPQQNPQPMPPKPNLQRVDDEDIPF